MQIHIPVLKDEVVKLFKDLDNGYYLDATLGYAGHASAILKNNNKLNLIACDQDIEAINYSKEKLKEFNVDIQIYKTNYENIFSFINNKNEIKGVLADIGVSSLQLDKDDRGFSFDSSELDMRMDKNKDFDAKTLINTYTSKQLSEIFKNYAELPEKLASDIASNIIKNRPINSCKELSKIIGNAKLNNRSVSLKTLIFQAIRIEVNDELGVLKRFLEQLKEFKNCLICIITFHSLEDKIVKDTFKKWANNCICDEFAIRCECGNNHSLGKIITKKPIEPSKEEIKYNSRSSCAKLRAFYLK
ncbi:MULTISPECIES: 16S rRNA (cytosine(1402)-N(4))-methyltransferase RsmH [unclassified Campylobacter]|uniref:16S rRNA (cytosine(1402)-N(4))-methyltransferase RsmH n=1 Tax=unclassified Campylobacter TaxID=2593542 RepID=UPI001BDAACAB|nr:MULTISPECIES: 16S rRNA (cytosine(1402)-N(4))-methyltransferase RsmH [unclassified Campylobacter]MBT0881106.1 16S rRNA (cytosine(1402)-N(4))-methyltransferase RsmH [Campylobacter sp. 2018MI27]MBT0884189.1 16S rRNA (cytosine(1402)-N(4))-methyltransferase RsmH [Campylobacter sp. 2018MI10]MBZ7975936.1 16S rRNA (cytosine(1402)-N(4))-methyltransferase RsmH [Campylobacter sp. RM12637]MBZ7992128.1 16S rRNA (cytosine(1402)-N(4))-methyltransferase RsmH [Campylobacter sp. RM9333]